MTVHLPGARHRSYLPSTHAFARRSQPAGAAFTRVEALAVILAVAALAATLLPAVARPGAVAGASCTANLAQLMRAWQLYAADYADYLPPNPDDGNMVPNYNWVSGYAGVGGSQQFNPDILSDPKRAMLAPYLGGDTTVYRCPADLRTGRYQGTNVILRGQTVPAARSYSMNQAVGTNPDKQHGKAAVDGPWLDGSHGHTANRTWYTFARTADFINPGPAGTWVLLDEDPNSLNDGGFATVGPYPGHQNYTMIDWPAGYHNFGAGFGFADGHAEIHQWQDQRTKVKSPIIGIAMQPNNPDIAWMVSHATALVRQAILTRPAVTSSDTFAVTVNSLKGASYYLEYKDSLTASNWTALPGVAGTNTGSLLITDPSPTAPQRFYRVRTP
jgi:prepilin-type processing-associated H-X9-DG protein